MITQLPTVVNASLSDITMAVQGYISPSNLGTSVQETWQQVFDLFLSNNILSYAGNPNGQVAGTTFQFLFDTVNKNLYICTTSGSATTAVWTQIGSNLQVLTNGQLLIGSTGNAPVAANLIGGTGITINNGAGSIEISSTGEGFTWNNVTTATQTLVSNNGYYTNNASGVVYTLPLVSSFGDAIRIIGKQTSWSVSQNAGQYIIFDSATSTVGVSGSISSTSARDVVEMICTIANTEWTVVGSIGNITVT